MEDKDREFEENKDRLYWTIGIVVALAIMAFVASLYEPLLRKLYELLLRKLYEPLLLKDPSWLLWLVCKSRFYVKQ